MLQTPPCYTACRHTKALPLAHVHLDWIRVHISAMATSQNFLLWEHPMLCRFTWLSCDKKRSNPPHNTRFGSRAVNMKSRDEKACSKIKDLTTCSRPMMQKTLNVGVGISLKCKLEATPSFWEITVFHSSPLPEQFWPSFSCKALIAPDCMRNCELIN